MINPEICIKKIIQSVFIKFLSYPILFIFCIKGLAAPVHKQYFLADGGVASICTLSQSVSNPAGTYCGKDWTFPTESIATSSFGVTSITSKNSDNSSVYNLEIDSTNRVSSTYAAVMQGYNFLNYRFGVFLVNQPGTYEINLSKANTNELSAYNIKLNSSSMQVGAFLSSGTGRWFYGGSLFYIRDELNMFVRYKRRDLINSSDYFYTGETKNIIHYLVGNLGLIYKGDWQYGISIQPMVNAIQGDEVQSYSVSSPKFYEGSGSSTIKDSQPWIGNLGIIASAYEYLKLYFDVSVASESKRSSDYKDSSIINISSNRKPSQTVGVGWKFTAGYLKNIKYIELGAGLYFQQTRQEKQNDSNENLMMNYGLVFTSSVKY